MKAETDFKLGDKVILVELPKNFIIAKLGDVAEVVDTYESGLNSYLNVKFINRAKMTYSMRSRRFAKYTEGFDIKRFLIERKIKYLEDKFNNRSKDIKDTLIDDLVGNF